MKLGLGVRLGLFGEDGLELDEGAESGDVIEVDPRVAIEQQVSGLDHDARRAKGVLRNSRHRERRNRGIVNAETAAS